MPGPDHHVTCQSRPEEGLERLDLLGPDIHRLPVHGRARRGRSVFRFDRFRLGSAEFPKTGPLRALVRTTLRRQPGDRGSASRR
jgi:hypothetical protein